MTALSTTPKTVVYSVTDLAASTGVFTALLGEPQTNAPYYVGFNNGGVEVGLAPHDPAQGPTGPVPFFEVADIAAAVAALAAAGATVVSEPAQVGGGRQVATVTDAEGNPIGLLQDS